MLTTTSKKTVFAALMLATGILLPFMISHGLLIVKGNILLPMHIPVIICSFLCGSVYGGICGFLVPYLSSLLTAMPSMYPNAIMMSFELLTYGVVCGFVHSIFRYSSKLRYIYISLISGMLVGRIVYGLVGSTLLFANPDLKNISVIAAVISGIPGIIIQLVIIPQIVRFTAKHFWQKHSVTSEAIKMIRSQKATFVVVKNNKILNASSPRGIAHLIEFHESGMLKDTFVADNIIGKAAAMIFSLSGVKSCYGQNVSKSALEILEKNNITVTYDVLTDFIQNRKGDGMCPMEETVLDVHDNATALKVLKEKIKELKKINTEK